MFESKEGVATDNPVTQERYKLSWVAYIPPFISTTALGCILYIFTLSAIESVFVYVAIALIFLRLLYKIAMVRSVTLFADGFGVWVYSGVFPWDSGIAGVKWQDVDDAVFYSGFLSWVLNAYSIQVGHRFTKRTELSLRFVRHGNEAVEMINNARLSFLYAGRA